MKKLLIITISVGVYVFFLGTSLSRAGTETDKIPLTDAPLSRGVKKLQLAEKARVGFSGNSLFEDENLSFTLNILKRLNNIDNSRVANSKEETVIVDSLLGTAINVPNFNILTKNYLTDPTKVTSKMVYLAISALALENLEGKPKENGSARADRLLEAHKESLTSNPYAKDYLSLFRSLLVKYESLVNARWSIVYKNYQPKKFEIAETTDGTSQIVSQAASMTPAIEQRTSLTSEINGILERHAQKQGLNTKDASIGASYQVYQDSTLPDTLHVNALDVSKLGSVEEQVKLCIAIMDVVQKKPPSNNLEINILFGAKVSWQTIGNLRDYVTHDLNNPFEVEINGGQMVKIKYALLPFPSYFKLMRHFPISKSHTPSPTSYIHDFGDFKHTLLSAIKNYNTSDKESALESMRAYHLKGIPLKDIDYLVDLYSLKDPTLSDFWHNIRAELVKKGLFTISDEK